MITVSPGLKAEIQKLRGRRLQARVKIDYSDVNLDNTIEGAASSTATNSYISQTYNGKEDVTRKWASLDGTWLLGEYALAPVTASERERYEIGWWSNVLTDASGNYGTPETLTLSFTPRTVSDINVSFDNARQEYAVDFDVVLKNESNVTLYTLVVTNNPSVKYATVIPDQNLVASITLIVRKWSHGLRQAKVAELFTSVSEIYNGDDIISLSVTENRQFDNETPIGTTASGKCTVTLYNRDRRFDYDNQASKLFNLIRENVRISPEIGDGTEWIPLGVFFAKAWDISKRSITATVTGVDRVALLGESNYSTSTVIEAPGDTSYLIDTAAEWNAGTLNNTVVSGNSLTL